MKQAKYLFWMVALTSILIIASCQTNPKPTSAPSIVGLGKGIKVEGGSFTNLSVTELQNLISKKDFLLVNVHIPFEGNLPKTDLSIPYDTIGQNLGKLPGDKTAKILLYCRSGRMSLIAATELVKLGYTNIWNLDGGMAAWEQVGLPIEK
jgi:rhodanese-related sulfurtransferase